MNKPIYLAGGCFWGMQKFLDQFDGVLSTEVGYANGPDKVPTYEGVCSNSGHAETVKVVYDETIIPLPELLGFYFMVIDPLSVNRQGNDMGIQYRTGIYKTGSTGCGCREHRHLPWHDPYRSSQQRCKFTSWPCV